MAGPGAGRLPDGAVRRRLVEGDPCPGRGDRVRRRRTQLRLSARHVGARHGLGGRAGARVRRNGRALVQGAYPHAGDRQADAEHLRHPPARAGGEEGRRRRGVADQHHQFDHGDRPRRDDAGRRDRRPRNPRRHVRPGGEADRARHGGGDRPRSRDGRPADLGDRRRHHLARRRRIHRARGRHGAGLHRGDDLRLQDRRGD